MSTVPTNHVAIVAQAEIEAVVGGFHGDPFNILGAHQVGDKIAIRAFLPQAESVYVLINTQKIPMERQHWDGFFECILPQTELPITYQFKIITPNKQEVIIDDPYAFPSTMQEMDAYLLAEGTHMHMYDKLGAHLRTLNNIAGTLFTIWAPNAIRVGVVGDFNSWDGRIHPMRFHPDSGIWELFMPHLKQGTQYKFEIKTAYKNYTVLKADPLAFYAQLRPDTASIVWDINAYQWQDEAWIADQQATANDLNGPISIYELHIGSWRRKNGYEWLTYNELSAELIPYVLEMGYTHIELMPVAEHPFDGSWGYQVTGYFAPTSRFGTPDEFMAFVDACHQANIGVILDWVPAHFPMDKHGLSFFDGTHLYEHSDPRKGTHPDWGTLIFNYGRNEIRQFLISNALFWLDKYHIDGLRVDAVASMLYLDFSREDGEWLPNQYGGRENIEALSFLREFNNKVHQYFPHALTIAEESTSWGGVTRPTQENGLGFDLKWNMGWMHDSLQYMSNDPIHRAYHHGSLTFSLLYAFSENFILPYSHDEVVHLKKSMLDKMPGDVWQKFANLRLLYGYQWAHPGKKLQFMGSEFGQWHEWTEAQSLDWHLLDSDLRHRGVQKWVADLNHLYQNEPALYAHDFSWEGFTWLDFQDSQRSLLAFSRQLPETEEMIIVAGNFTPVVRHGYRLGVPKAGDYVELLNSDQLVYGGGGVINEGVFTAVSEPWHNQPYSIQLTLPPLGITYLKLKTP